MQIEHSLSFHDQLCMCSHCLQNETYTQAGKQNANIIQTRIMQRPQTSCLNYQPVFNKTCNLFWRMGRTITRFKIQDFFLLYQQEWLTALPVQRESVNSSLLPMLPIFRYKSRTDYFVANKSMLLFQISKVFYQQHMVQRIVAHFDNSACLVISFTPLMVSLIFPRTKWLPIRSRYFKMPFLEWKCMTCDWHFTEIRPQGPIANKPTLVQIMAWRRIYAALERNELIITSH